ncbi:voltage-dependent calcium channel gamma-6 subunit isoform X1 [Hippocampus zosterae]|uniref:voltage-dependent calcium channel gamma-6 subunit isoform X1 n=1 Tax=Hippocampus zosterae TaxID=109293 RepID=UPI00223C8C2C|nr:voltage-dependent calcium channel gamma-6 subunit isoform X1 [Hippocampus zosterae]
MWNNFFVARDEEGRMGAAGGGQGGALAALQGGRAQRRSQKMSDSQNGKIKLAFLVCAVGVTLTVLAVGTEFWVELAQPKDFGGNQTCQLAHYGLWKTCVRTLWVADVDPERASCGPAELPGESNCTYFKFFTSGENAVMFKKTTNKSENSPSPRPPSHHPNDQLLTPHTRRCPGPDLRPNFPPLRTGLVVQRPRRPAASPTGVVGGLRGLGGRRPHVGRRPFPRPFASRHFLAEVFATQQQRHLVCGCGRGNIASGFFVFFSTPFF